MVVSKLVHYIFVNWLWNKIVNKFLLNGDKFLSELHLRQPRFTYSTWEPFTKHYKKIQKSRETGNLTHIYQNKLDKDCFAHDADFRF